MIDRTLLTETLADLTANREVFVAEMGAERVDALTEAARWAIDFPTDEQVEAAMEMIPGIPRGEIVDALEAVTMIGDNQ